MDNDWINNKFNEKESIGLRRFSLKSGYIISVAFLQMNRQIH